MNNNARNDFYEGCRARAIMLALEEDRYTGDITTLATIEPLQEGRAVIKAKEDGVIGGVDVAMQVFAACDPASTTHLAKFSSSRSCIIQSAILFTSQKSTLMAFFNTSATPDCRDIMMGTSYKSASNGEMPNGSDTEGITYRSLMAYIRSTSSPCKNPVK